MSNNTDHNEDEIEIQHRILIEEEEINISDLPPEVRNAMRKFNAKMKEYEETEDSDLFYELQQDDIAIADDITTWLEDIEGDENDEQDDDDSYMSDEDEQSQNSQAKNTNSPTNTSDIENKIRANAKNGVISIDDLQSILGREPNYPSEKIGSLVLNKQYLKPFYELK
jgi:hypothetical protein